VCFSSIKHGYVGVSAASHCSSLHDMIARIGAGTTIGCAGRMNSRTASGPPVSNATEMMTKL